MEAEKGSRAKIGRGGAQGTHIIAVRVWKGVDGGLSILFI